MTSQEWKAIAPLLRAWVRSKSEPIDHSVYERVLAQFDAGHVSNAILDLALSAVYTPTAAEIARKINDMCPADAVSADRLALIAERQVAAEVACEEESLRRDRELEAWCEAHPDALEFGLAWLRRHGIEPPREAA